MALCARPVRACRIAVRRGEDIGFPLFLCQVALAGRGRGADTTTFHQDGDQEGDKGVWMSVWVDDVDEMHKQCVAAGLEVTFPPTHMPWNVREMHLRHPDGHGSGSAADSSPKSGNPKLSMINMAMLPQLDREGCRLLDLDAPSF